MKKSSSHQFAIHLLNLSELISNSRNTENGKIILKDKNLSNRLFSVLRFSIGDNLIFFDKLKHIFVEIVSWSKNGDIIFKILEVKNNIILLPRITWLLPVLKRTALEEAIYSLGEIGVTSIQLVITEKSQKNSLDPKYLERLKSIIVAAAEQSKNFNYPDLLSPIKLKDIVFQDNNLKKIYFDPAGESSFKYFSNINLNKKFDNTSDFIVMCGPEGDLEEEEKNFLKSLGFEFLSLTQTVLRSSQAVAIGSGLLRLK